MTLNLEHVVFVTINEFFFFQNVFFLPIFPPSFPWSDPISDLWSGELWQWPSCLDRHAQQKRGGLTVQQVHDQRSSEHLACCQLRSTFPWPFTKPWDLETVALTAEASTAQAAVIQRVECVGPRVFPMTFPPVEQDSDMMLKLMAFKRHACRVKPAKRILIKKGSEHLLTHGFALPSSSL